MAAALERVCARPASVRSALGLSTRHPEPPPHSGPLWGPHGSMRRTANLSTKSCTRSAWGEPCPVTHRGQPEGRQHRKGVRAQATRKQGGKVALVGKKLQLKPPAQRPQQKEAGEARKEERQDAKVEGASAVVEQPKRVERADEKETAQPAEVDGRTKEGTASTSAAEAVPARKEGEGAKAEASEALTPEEQAAQLQALRKSLQGQPGGEPVKSSGAFYAGVLEEIGLINWPPVGQVAGTTALVMGMLVGAATVLTVLNYGLSEGTKAFFEDGPLRDAVKGTFGL